ncbi:hypothetical protein [Salidesulfovibrio onnuriiensis]|uniref:hypothetical protein n=1 Tax=Salidesulfovibrio onnuriiensis TaxID=2583823 RepID=UPI0011CA628B|nr:hypothetical protein [Salidesulfovibrio onnuriiensis]
MRFFLLFIAAVAAFAHPVCAEDKLHWTRLDMPPINIVRDPLKDQGYADKFLADFLPVMKGFEHHVFVCSVARTLELISETPNTCNMTLLYQKKRDQYVHYSDAIMGLVPNRVLVVAGNEGMVLPYLSEEGVDLARLMRDSNLLVGLINGRAYGEFIDTQLEAAKPFKNVAFLPKSVLGARQLFAGRVDVLVAYVHEALYYKKTQNILEDVVSFPIKGEQLVDMYMGCSDSPEGRRAVAEINRLLDGGMRGVFLNHYLEWVDKGSQKDVLRHVSGWSGVE